MVFLCRLQKIPPNSLGTDGRIDKDSRDIVIHQADESLDLAAGLLDMDLGMQERLAHRGHMLFEIFLWKIEVSLSVCPEPELENLVQVLGLHSSDHAIPPCLPMIFKL